MEGGKINQKDRADDTSLSNTPARTSPCPPERFGVAARSHFKILIPSVMRSEGPFETTTGPPRAAATSGACRCHWLPISPSKGTPTAFAMRPSSETLGVRRHRAYPWHQIMHGRDAVSLSRVYHERLCSQPRTLTLMRPGSRVMTLTPLPSTINVMPASRATLQALMRSS